MPSLPNDGAAQARSVGLTYVGDETPGYRRVRRGSGFSYVAPDGVIAEGAERSRIAALAIPPAWQEVWISTDETSHLQATGYDDAGRKQYIYHPRWEHVRDQAKFDRLGDFAQRLVALRKCVDGQLRRPGLDRAKVVALAVAVLDETLIRVGNRRYARDNDTYGLTTLKPEHVEVQGTHVLLDFVGKGGSEQQHVFRDRRIARLISQCRDLSGETLFTYETIDGLAQIASTDVNEYLAASTGTGFTAKDFRIWGATTTVARALASGTMGSTGKSAEDEAGSPARDRLLEAIDSAAERIGNTRAVCRSAYVHPVLPEAFEGGALTHAWKRSRSGRWLDRAESTVRYLLQ